MADSERTTDDLLRDHASAMRRLALRLTGRADDADDAVQETFLQALRSPAALGARAGGWLATVLRRTVARSRRDAQRRERRHAEADAAHPAMAPADILQHAEQASRLLAAVRDLPAPLRDVVWQRYFEDLPPRAIAETTGTPLHTVKSRLRDALVLLRARLGQNDGGQNGDDWRLALTAAFGLPSPKLGVAATTTIQTTTFGVLTMTGWSKIVGAAAAGAVLCALLLVSPPRPNAPVAPLASNERTIAEVGSLVPPPSTDREATAPVAQEVTVASLAPVAELRGRVVAADGGAPVPDAVVTVATTMAVRPPEDATATRTDHDGRFRLVVPAAARLRLWLEHPEHIMVWRDHADIAAGLADDCGELQIHRGFTVAGRVVDERGHAAPAGVVLLASFWLKPPVSGGTPQLRATTRDDGSFTFDGRVSPGTIQVHVPPPFELVSPEMVPVAAHGSELELVVRASPTIRGRVVDLDGRPIAGIGIGSLPGETTTTTADDGSFVLVRRYPKHEQVPLRVIETTAHLPCEPVTVVWGTSDVRLTLAPLPSVPIEVVDESDAPVTSFGVAMLRDTLPDAERGLVRMRGEHEGGRCDVPAVEPGKTRLRIVPTNLDLVPSPPIAIDDVAPHRIVLTTRRRVAVHVARAGGPLAGATVTWVAGNPRHASNVLDPQRDGRTAHDQRHVERVDAGTTGADGLVHLHVDRDAAECWLIVNAPDAAVEHVPVPSKRLAPDRVDIDVPGRGRVAGRIALHGAARGTASIRLERPGSDEWRSVGPQPDGTFVVDGLHAGPWTAYLVTRAKITSSRRELVVAHGETTPLDYDLAAHQPAAVRARLLGAAADAGPLCVELFWADGRQPQAMALVDVDATGSFAAENLPPGNYLVGVHACRASDLPPESSRLVPGLLAEPLLLHAGATLHTELPFVRRRLVLRLARQDGASTKAVGLFAQCAGRQWPSFSFTPPRFDDEVVLDPAPMLPFSLRLAAGSWSEPIVTPTGKGGAEMTVVLPAAR